MQIRGTTPRGSRFLFQISRQAPLCRVPCEPKTPCYKEPGTNSTRDAPFGNERQVTAQSTISISTEQSGKFLRLIFIEESEGLFMIKSRPLVLVLILVLLITTLTGCASYKGATPTQAPRASESYDGAAKFGGNVAYTVSGTAMNNASVVQFSSIEPNARKVISTGSLSLAVQSLDSAQQEVRDILAAQGGHIQHSYFNNIEGNQYWEFTLRIPSPRFVQTMTLLSELGRIRTSNTGEQDVTEEYMDLDARLRVLHQEEERLLELLKLAVTMDDFLKIESNLSRVRVNIEQTTGRLRFLDDRINFSTLSLNLRPEAGAVEPELKGFAGLGKRIRNGFRDGMNLFVDLVAGIMGFAAMSLPTLILLVLGLYVIYRLLKLVRRRPTSSTNTGKEPPLSM